MIRNYRKKHYTIIFATAVLAILQVLTMLPFDAPNWIEKIVFVSFAFGLGFLGIGEKTQKADELTRAELYKANTITMFCALLCIFVFSLFGDDNTVQLNYNVFVFCFCGLVILRSVVFLIFDISGNGVSDDEE